MKAACYILALYILALGALPCCAIDSCPDDKQEMATGHVPGDNDCGNCSPFFSCEGCAVASVPFQPACWDIDPVINPTVHTGFLISSLPSTYFDFWQPPRMG